MNLPYINKDPESKQSVSYPLKLIYASAIQNILKIIVNIAASVV
jgi:hypothetical protein